MREVEIFLIVNWLSGGFPVCFILKIPEVDRQSQDSVVGEVREMVKVFSE